MDELKIFLGYKENRKLIADQCGANAKIPASNQYKKEIEAIKLETGEDFTDEDIQMLVLGAMMDDEVMKNCSTSSSNYFDSPDFFKRDNIFMLVLNNTGDRELSLQQGMVQARLNVKKALENARKSNNMELINRYRRNLADYLNVAGAMHVYDGTDDANTYLYLYKTVTKLVDEGKFDAELLNLETFERMRESMTLADLLDEAFDKEKELLSNKELGDKQRKELLTDILTNLLIVRYVKQEMLEISDYVQKRKQFLDLEGEEYFDSKENKKFRNEMYKKYPGIPSDIVENEWESAPEQAVMRAKEEFKKTVTYYSQVIFSDIDDTIIFKNKLRSMVESSDMLKEIMALSNDKLEAELIRKLGTSMDILDNDKVVEKANRIIEFMSENTNCQIGKINEAAASKKEAQEDLLKNLVTKSREEMDGLLKKRLTKINQDKAEKDAKEEYGDENVSEALPIAGELYFYVSGVGFFKIAEENGEGVYKPVDKLPFVVDQTYRNAYYNLMFYKLTEGDVKNGCNAHNNIKKVVEFLEEGKHADGEVIGKIKSLIDEVNRQFDGKTRTEMGADELKALAGQYKDVISEIEKFMKSGVIKGNPEKALGQIMNHIKNQLSADADVINSVVNEPKGSIKVYLENLFDEAARGIAQDDERKINEAVNREFLKAGENPLDRAVDYAGALTRNYIYNNFYDRRLDGSFARNGEKFLDKDGKEIDRAATDNFLINNEKAMRESLAKKLNEKPVRALTENELQAVNGFINDAKLTDASTGNARARQNEVETVRSSILKATGLAEFEDALSSDRMAEKKPFAFYSPFCKKLSGSEADREWNRKLDEKLNSASAQDKKEGMEMLLDNLNSLKPEEYINIKDDSYLKNADHMMEIMKLAAIGPEIKNILKTAQDMGIDLNLKKYAPVYKNESAFEILGLLWKNKLSMWVSPVSEHIDPNAAVAADTEMLKAAAGNDAPQIQAFFNGAAAISEQLSELQKIYVEADEPLLKSMQSVLYQKEKSIISTMCGSHPVFPEKNPYKAQIEAVTIETNSFSEEEIQLIVLGSMMDKEIMDKCSSSSSAVGDNMESFKRDNIFVNFLKQNSSRELLYSENMVQARKNALEAIRRAEASGDRSLIDRYHKNVADYLNATVGTHIYDGGADTSLYMTFYHLVDDLIIQGKFDAKLLSYKTKSVIDCDKELENILKDAYTKEKRLQNDVLSADDRKRLVTEILRDHLIVEYASKEIRPFENSLGDSLTFNKMIHKLHSEEMKEYLEQTREKNKDIDPLEIDTFWESSAQLRVKKLFTSEFEQKMPLYTPILLGDEKLKKKLYAELDAQVSETDIFKELLNADNEEKLNKAFTKARSGQIDIKFGADTLSSMENIALKIQSESKDELLEATTDIRQQMLVAHTDSLEKDWKESFENALLQKRSEINKAKLKAELDGKYGDNSRIVLDGEIYYSTSDGKYALSERVDAENWKEKIVDDLPFPEGEAGRSGYYQVRKKQLSASHAQDKCQVSARLGGYIQEMGKIAELDESGEIVDMLGVLYDRVNKALAEKAEYSSDDFASLKDEYEECIAAMDKYSEKHPKNELVKDAEGILKEDLADITPLSEKPVGTEPMPFAEVFVENEKNVAAQDIETRTGTPTVIVTKDTQLGDKYYEYYNKLTNKYIAGRVKVRLDGSFKKDAEGYEVLDSGVSMKGFVRADILTNEKEAYKAFLKANSPKVSYELDEETKNILRTFDKDRQVPDDATISERQAKIKWLNEQMDELSFNRIIEERTNETLKIGLSRELLGTVIKKADTDNDRKWNRKMLSLVSSDDKREVKAGFEMLLDYAKEFDPLHEPTKIDIKVLMNIKDDSALYDKKKLSKIYEMSQITAELVNVFNTAKKCGVDVYSPEYDGLRKSMDAMQNLSLLWKTKINYYMSPASAYLTMDELAKYDRKTLDQVGDIFEDFYAASTLTTNFEPYLNAVDESGSYLKSDKPFVFDEYRHAISRTNSVDKDDDQISKLRKQMMENKRVILFGWKRKNSKLYSAVVKAIDDYCDAPVYRKNVMRKKLIKACENYHENRLAENDRYELVTQVKQWALKSEKYTLSLARKAAGGAINRILDNFSERLKTVEKEQPAGNAGPDVRKMTLSEAVLDDKWLQGAIIKTKEFAKFFNKTGGYEPDKEKYNKICDNIMTEIAAEYKDFSIITESLKKPVKQENDREKEIGANLKPVVPEV